MRFTRPGARAKRAGGAWKSVWKAAVARSAAGMGEGTG